MWSFGPSASLCDVWIGTVRASERLLHAGCVTGTVRAIERLLYAVLCSYVALLLLLHRQLSPAQLDMPKGIA